MPERPATSRSSLRPIEVIDEAAVTALLRLPEVRRYLLDDICVSAAEVAAWIAEARDPASLSEMWAIETEDGSLIGLAGLRAPTGQLLQFRAIGWRSLEVVVALAPQYWGRGLASRAVEALADQARAYPQTFALVGVVDESNARSQRLMRRCGFHELGRLPDPEHPCVVYELAL